MEETLREKIENCLGQYSENENYGGLQFEDFDHLTQVENLIRLFETQTVEKPSSCAGVSLGDSQPVLLAEKLLYIVYSYADVYGKSFGNGYLLLRNTNVPQNNDEIKKIVLRIQKEENVSNVILQNWFYLDSKQSN